MVQRETEKFRGKAATFQILTLSCSYDELLRAAKAGGAKPLTVRLHRVPEIDVSAEIALVHPISAPAMLSMYFSDPEIRVGDELSIPAHPQP